MTRPIDEAAKAADAAINGADKYLNQATTGIQAAQRQTQGWLRRNVWGVVGVAVVLAVVAVLALRFG